MRKRLISLVAILSMALSTPSVAFADDSYSVVEYFESALNKIQEFDQGYEYSSDDYVYLDSGRVLSKSGEDEKVSIDFHDDSLGSVGLDNYSTSPNGSSIAVVDEGAGSFRSLIHIPNEESTNTFVFTFDDDVVLSEMIDGGVLVQNHSGDTLGTLDSPWALDSSGTPVETWYEINGVEIIQHISASASTSFPVVADPFWIPFLGIMGGHFTRHALMKMAQRKVTQELVEYVIKNGRTSRGNNNTTIFSGNGIRVVVDNNSGNIVTVTKG